MSLPIPSHPPQSACRARSAGRIHHPCLDARDTCAQARSHSSSAAATLLYQRCIWCQSLSVSKIAMLCLHQCPVRQPRRTERTRPNALHAVYARQHRPPPPHGIALHFLLAGQQPSDTLYLTSNEYQTRRAAKMPRPSQDNDGPESVQCDPECAVGHLWPQMHYLLP